MSHLLYVHRSPETIEDLWVLPLTGDRKPAPFAHTPFIEREGRFSPDTRWIAYTSFKSGRAEVYVRPFPARGGNYQVSRDGGSQPMWRGDGRELFFLSPDRKLMAAGVRTASSFEASIPSALFPTAATGFAVTQDGQRFLLNVPEPSGSAVPLTVVMNWRAPQ